jgi:subtilase family serine protease
MLQRLATAVAVLTVLVGGASGAVAATHAGAKLPKALPAHGQMAVCGATLFGASCQSHVVTADGGATPLATSTYQYGYSPQNLADAYKWADPTGSTWSGNGRTIAIVDAYDNPNAAADLAVYRNQFGLPPCTTGNGCFRKINQRNGSTPPTGDVGWGEEIALDLDMASAVCPQCKILLVEADSNSLANLGAAVNQAASQGATAISNSYGAGEFFGETSYESYYNHPGVAVTVSSGDNGYGVEFPAASRYVVAVGGTSLTTNGATPRGWAESAWSGAGSGCSSQVSKPSWQTDSGCSRRTVADVSAVADPNTGVAVYDSYGSTGGNNWYVFGGTSVAAPIIAGVYGLAGIPAGTSYPASYAYAHTASLFDVTSGSNGSCRRGKRTTAVYLCTAGSGYDGPTGLGTPNGTGGF